MSYFYKGLRGKSSCSWQVPLLSIFHLIIMFLILCIYIYNLIVLSLISIRDSEVKVVAPGKYFYLVIFHLIIIFSILCIYIYNLIVPSLISIRDSVVKVVSLGKYSYLVISTGYCNGSIW